MMLGSTLMPTVADQPMAAAKAETWKTVLAGKRILFFHVTLGMGGAERQSLLLARWLRDEGGADVEIWGWQGGEFTSLCDRHGVPWRVVPFQWSGGRWARLNALRRFALALRRARPDVLLPYTTLPNVVLGLVYPFTGARACLWNQRAADPYAVGVTWEALAARNRLTFVSNSEHGADYLARRWGVPRPHVHVVPNGVRLEEARLSRAEWRQRLGLDARAFVACMLAVLRDNKDHETLLRGWRAFLDGAGHDVQPCLLLPGRADNVQDRVKALAFDLGLWGTVQFLGHVDDVTGLLTACDLAVFATRYEGVPNGVLESMAMGLAVVATDHPGVREAIGPAMSSECLCAPEDHAALAAKIRQFATDVELRQRHGRRNRLRIEEHFAPERACALMGDVIVRALAN